MTVIDYEPSDKSTRKPFTSISLSVALALIVGGWLAVALFFVPQVAQVLKGFNTEIPYATQLVLELSVWSENPYVLCSLLLVPIVVPILTTYFFWRPRSVEERRRRRKILIRIVGGVIALMVVVVIVSVVLPTVSLIQSVSGSK